MTEKSLNALGRWMKENRYSDLLFALEVSRRQPRAVTPHTVFNWRHGLRIPRPISMMTIREITNGEVLPEHFLKGAINGKSD